MAKRKMVAAKVNAKTTAKTTAKSAAKPAAKPAAKKKAFVNDEDGQIKMDIPEEPKVIRHDWRTMYTESELNQAQRFVERGQYRELHIEEACAQARIGISTNAYHASIDGEPSSYSDDWDPDWLDCTCVKGSGIHKKKRKSRRYSIYGGFDPFYESDDERGKAPCSHTAALFLLWEKAHGPWEFTETAKEKAERLKREKEERIAREEERRRRAEEKRERERIQQEKERLENLKKEEEAQKRTARDYLDPLCEYRKDAYFDIQKIAGQVKTNLYEIHRAKKLQADTAKGSASFSIVYGQDGDQRLHATIRVKDAQGSDAMRAPEITIARDQYIEHQCYCKGYYSLYGYGYRNTDRTTCAHELILLRVMADYVNEHNPGDATDKAAEEFFQALSSAPSAQEAARTQQKKEKDKVAVLQPLLSLEGGIPKLTFRIGLRGGKMLLLKQLRDFAEKYESEKTYTPSKTVSIDFSSVDFEEESQPWLVFILQRISDTDHINNSIQSRSWYGYSSRASLQNYEQLEGAMLDRFYDIAEGSLCELQEKKTGKANSMIYIGHRNMQVSISSSKIKGSGGSLIGVELTGRMPVIIKGSRESYILDDHALSRITREEERVLRPFRSASDANGYIHFCVGKDKLAEFYYRVVPELIEQSFVDFTDAIARDVKPLLPPEPEFTFRVDQDQDRILCRTTVSYDGKEQPLSDDGKRTGYRDAEQEKRVQAALQKYFPRQDEERGCRSGAAGEDALYRLLQEGVPELNRYGTVLVSEALSKIQIRSTPQFKLGVSIDSGILDLELLSKDVSPKELLAILASYRKKKKYHVMKSGDYVTFEEADALDALLGLTEGMDLDVKALSKGKLHLPAYRALYLDKLLEEHDALGSNRDRTYRTMIKNFQTIRDADYEVPEGMSDTLRPYQAYGYKWLRTLQGAGFGGILADEMGLGKTVQAIAAFLSWHEEGLDAPVLVVCPASLVYNWQEEIARFAPKLSVQAIAGNAAERAAAEKLLGAKKGKFPEISIISYDLLRRDISAFEKTCFHAVVIDEAQYIKNQKAAMTKAVKVLKASYRYALTGTPIENRLAELWSIFDFLMPGFLYDYATFADRFETPIVKGNDKSMSERLKQMVRPFILRRLKTEVLKDLPEKLEEVRYARFDDEQRKVYDGQVVLMRGMIGKGVGTGAEKIRILAELTRLRELCCDPSLILENYRGGSAKREACMELIESAMEGGHRMLVFSQFTSMLELLEADLKERKIDYYKITGATAKEQRLKLVHQFNEGEVPVFLISLKAGGTGLNLTGADVVIHYDPWWNLAVQNQATDRAHRIGQKNKVTVYRMIIKDTIEEKILALQEAKKDLADEILSGEGKSLSAMSAEELLALLD